MQHLTSRRLFLTAAATLAALAAGPATAQASPVAGALENVLEKKTGVTGSGWFGEHGRHRLTITVDGTEGAADGTYTLECAPNGGSHASPGAACARLDQLAADGLNPFKPVPRGTMCTQQYGGPQTARVRGQWQGRHIDAVFSRADGCEISRWNSLVPVLPAADGA
ncbi:SSI family serine proteinase inhibitor [Streptomyces typhae]|uniref:SSI family serine proteinase inhibitor n=1 Tax=Streptomyces typhae TaxID=2681492 RepID=UPI0031B5ED3D